MTRGAAVLAFATQVLLAQSPETARPRNPIVRVVSISQDGLDRSHPKLLEHTLDRLRSAASFHPDIATLPEVFLPEPETIPGPVTAKLAAWAREQSSYVLFGLRTRSAGKLYNSAILLDRQGKLAGQYHKIHPTENELKDGVHPGPEDPPVFEADFGKIGIQICFDVNWWSDWRRLKDKGARIVFFPAAYPAARQLGAVALANQMFIVSSTQNRLSRIYDITGEELAVSGRFQPWAGAAVPIGRRLFEIDFHTSKAKEILRKYGSRVDLRWYHEDDWFTLASLDPALTVEDLIAEFGLTPLDDYRARADRAIREAR
jgi:predicted amidohydrolase